MIYEIQLINLRLLLYLIPLLILFFLSKKIYKNNLVSKNGKIKIISLLAIIFGGLPTVGVLENISAYISYVNGEYKEITGKFISSQSDGRRAFIAIEGSQLNYHLYKSRCLVHSIQAQKDRLLTIKYLNNRSDACILSISYTKNKNE